MDVGFNKSLQGSRVFKTENASLSYYDLPGGYLREYSTSDRIRFITVFSGTVEYTFQDETIQQTNRHMMMLPSYSTCNIQVVQQARLMVLEVEDSLIKTVYANVRSRKPFNEAIDHPKPYILFRFDNDLYDSFQKIHREYSTHPENPYLIELDICRLIYTLLNTEYAGYLFSIKASHPMEEVKFYIQRNIKNPIRINVLADIAGMNNSNFTNTFRRHFGKSPLEYIHESKVSFAQELLKDHSVTDVAYDLGYENVSSFIAQFKKINRVTPKQYQLMEQ